MTQSRNALRSADSLRSLAELQPEIGQLQSRFAQAVAQAETTSEGTDPSGAVTVILGPDGLARDVRIAGDWHRRLRAAQMAEAVVAADSDAAQRRAQATAEAFASIQDEPSEWAVSPAAELAAYGSATPARPRHLLDLADLADLASAAFDDIGRMTAPPAPITGAGAGGAVRVSVAQSRITGCDIDLPWLRRQDDTTLAHALREALSSGIAAQSEADRPAAEFSRRLAELLADAKATLRGIHRMPD